MCEYILYFEKKRKPGRKLTVDPNHGFDIFYNKHLVSIDIVWITKILFFFFWLIDVLHRINSESLQIGLKQFSDKLDSKQG